MNLNDYVVPNNKTRSVKLNARNLHKLQLDTTTLASESKKMEEKLKQLKENMSKEKEERRHFRDLRWKFGQCISSISNPQPNSFKKINDNKIQKLPAGKIKIRVLKDEPLPAPPQSSSSSSIPNAGLGMTKRTRVKGTISRKCEVKSTKLVKIVECVQNEQLGCYLSIGQKGALKLHNRIFIRRSNITSANSLIMKYCSKVMKLVLSQIKTVQKDAALCNKVPRPSDESINRKMELHAFTLNVFFFLLYEMYEIDVHANFIKYDKSELANSIFTGQYSEEESARSFQEALIQWRKERSEGKESLVTTDVLETSTTPGVKFSENSLTYMDKLLLKKHR
uniref:Uncharacterized protein n=1 Tax=Poecilia formosa TaxID=48698 RepID=A0A096MCT3_POEFO